MGVKRVLWLYNHVSLMKSEVRIIRELGYEVYIPKKPPFDVSIAVDWESDQLLTIPKEAIDVLNQVDFYDSLIPAAAMELMNRYFEMAIFGPFIEPLKSLVLGFRGILVFHPFGLEDGMTYTKIIQEMGGDWLLLAIERLGKRFWFGQSYDNLYEIECEFFANHRIDLPIGMLDTTIETGWTGKKNKVLFICPRIKINSYYENVYKKFKEDFKDLPYSIGGVQPIKYENDPTILGYLPQSEFDTLFFDYSVMFYHSQERHHIHYHPFEAIKKGLPLIFMAGGLLDHLGGKELPGRAKNIKEARKKCKRILNGDKKFIEEVRKSQEILLKPMDYAACKAKWQESLRTIEAESETKVCYDKKNSKRVAIILPLGYTGGVLDYTLRLVTALYTSIKNNNKNIEVVLAYLDDEIYQKEDYFESVRNLGITLRKYRWETFPRERLETTLELAGSSRKLLEKEYILPNDGISYFRDCDYFIFTSDHVPGYPLILKPYGVVLHDYIQRYMPEMLEDYQEREWIDFSRSAMLCYTTTDNTKNDAVNYAGISENKIIKLPLFFEKITHTQNTAQACSYFVWSTNVSEHKNHKIALEALEEYYENGGTLKCYMTGTNTLQFVSGTPDNDYVNEVCQKINSSNYLKSNISILGYLKKNEFYQVLSRAAFLFHPGYADNGNGTAFDAAMLGVPSLSSDYQAMRNMNEVCDLNITFFDRSNEKQMADILLYAEKNRAKLKANLPQIEKLIQHTVQDSELCEQLFECLLKNVGV